MNKEGAFYINRRANWIKRKGHPNQYANLIHEEEINIEEQVE